MQIVAAPKVGTKLSKLFDAIRNKNFHFRDKMQKVAKVARHVFHVRFLR
jgi:hypothetical protein